MTVRLTPEQDDLANHFTGPALGLAVAGAGKTTCQLVRVDRLVRAHGVQPGRILMATFSKRGAADMRRRASVLCVPAGVQYRTLHSVAFEYLRQARTKRRVEVAKDWMMSRICRDTLKALERGGSRNLPKPGDVRREIGLAKSALVWPRLASEAGFVDGAWTSAAGLAFPDYRTWAVSRDREPLSDTMADIVNTCYIAWELASRAPEAHGWEDKAGTRLVTFDDMLAIVARDILLARSWTSEFRGCYDFVQVDEVQDNNLAQWVLCEHIVRDNNILAVGDDQQSIFAFRGAQPALMREFLDRHAGAKVFHLTYNFRCGQTILDAANGVLANATERLYDGDLQRGRGPEAVGYVTAHAFATVQEEALAVIESIETAIKDEGQNPDEVAVLYRLNAMSGPLEVACIKRGLLYKIAGSSFFARGEIKAAIGYIGLVLNEADEVSFKAAYNCPNGRYLGNEFLRKCPNLTAARNALADGSAGRWARGIRSIIQAVERVSAILNRPKDGGVTQALEYIFEEMGVAAHFRDEAAGEEDETEVEQACEALIICAGTIGDPGALVNYAREMTKVGHEDVGVAEGERTPTPRITLSSCHKAKGLEWDRVYAVGLTENTFPFYKAPLEEERRLGYVTLTRARDHLWVSWTTEGEGQRGPSCLVEEAKLIHLVDDSAKVAAEAPATGQAEAVDTEPPCPLGCPGDVTIGCDYCYAKTPEDAQRVLQLYKDRGYDTAEQLQE